MMAAAQVTTIADLQRGFNALCDKNIQYKPFYNQLAKAEFPEFMRSVLEHLLNTMVCTVLRSDQGSPFARFERIVIHDGTSFALKYNLQGSFPGRFTDRSPAAVELHVSMDLLRKSVEHVVLAPDRNAEVHYRPDPADLAGSLLLCDRAFFSKDYVVKITNANAHFIIRANRGLNPRIRHAWRSDGTEIRSWGGSG
jgi:hypothetical protein